MTRMLSQADKQGCGAHGFATAELRAGGGGEQTQGVFLTTPVSPGQTSSQRRGCSLSVFLEIVVQ